MASKGFNDTCLVLLHCCCCCAVKLRRSAIGTSVLGLVSEEVSVGEKTEGLVTEGEGGEGGVCG